MDVRLSPLIRWPGREELWRTMPQCFKFSFRNNTTVIIYCFEVFCVTPQGRISFVSEAWGGRTSDKYLTENFGLLDKLLPGDLVMTDRGFTIHDGVALKHNLLFQRL